MPDSTDAAPRGTSRRDVLRRGGIVVGLAWTAPVVQSMLSPAFATGSEASHGLCDRLVFIKWRVSCSDRKSYWVNQEDYANKTCYTNMVSTIKQPPQPGQPPLMQPPVPLVTPASIVKQTKSWAQLKGDSTNIYATYDPKKDSVTFKAPDDCRVVAFQVYLSNTKGCPPTIVNPQPFPQEITAPVPLVQTYSSSRHATKPKLVSVSMILCCND